MAENINYSITIKNTTNSVISDIEIENQTTGEAWEIDTLDINEEEVIDTYFVVNEEDILNGKIELDIQMTYYDEEGEQHAITKMHTFSVEEPNPSLEISLDESLSSDLTRTYNLGDSIELKFKINNNGNLNVNNIKILCFDSHETNLSNIYPDTIYDYHCDYIIKASDVSNGSVELNTKVTGTATNNESISKTKAVTIQCN